MTIINDPALGIFSKILKPGDDGFKASAGEDYTGRFYFYVVNLTRESLKGELSWRRTSNDRGATANVDGLGVMQISDPTEFYPVTGDGDWWQWSERGRWYHLNIYEGDNAALVTISNYGINVIPRHTNWDDWAW